MLFRVWMNVGVCLVLVLLFDLLFVLFFWFGVFRLKWWM